ncbi:hypothetical protein Taro_004671 [Colocasia esculenta]|uniref:RRM domain-containing protein n=1 Tax=Colocasia esculenta TaxID=4460 RepID=A0A843TMP6_COLES|nr:hypothetical protein [Colocasia esculenta]
MFPKDNDFSNLPCIDIRNGYGDSWLTPCWKQQNPVTKLGRHPSFTVWATRVWKAHAAPSPSGAAHYLAPSWHELWKMRRVGGGRERGRGEHPPRVEEKGAGSGGGGGHHHGRPEAPPSRHLWVGNLPPHATQSMLLEHFLRFGDLENIAFLPGRSYAFVNFRKEEDAIYALRTLQGHTFAGMPLKIEFQKGVSCVNLYTSSVCYMRRICTSNPIVQYLRSGSIHRFPSLI